jgi:hypothetical protein
MLIKRALQELSIIIAREIKERFGEIFEIYR